MVVPYVIGVDLGGSVTRVLVVDTDGNQVGYGTAGGGNPVSRGLDATVDSLSAALSTALAGLEVDRVAYAVLGLAGVSTFGAAVDAEIETVWRSAGLSCPRSLRPDPEVAFAAGTAETEGFVLVAGTGAIAGYVRDGHVVRSVDGHGWLLGDRGSGFWLGREAVLAALASGERTGPMTPLRTAVVGAMGLDVETVTSPEIARAVYQRPPIALSEFAPLVTRAAADGDAVAGTIVDRAAAALLESVRTAVRSAGSPRGLPVVMGGGVLTAYQPLCDEVWRGIVALGLEPCMARPPAVGAVVLAIRALTDQPLLPRTLDALMA